MDQWRLGATRFSELQPVLAFYNGQEEEASLIWSERYTHLFMGRRLVFTGQLEILLA